MLLLNHLWDVVCLGVVIVGPAPLSLGAAASAGNSNSLTHRLLAASIWWCAIQCSLGIALGLVGQLRLLPLLACEIVVGFLGGLALRRRGPTTPAWSALILARRPDQTHWRLVFIGAILSTATATLLASALTQPITEFDSLAYHLPQIAHWFQDGSLDPLPNLRQIARYPFSWEVLQLLFVLPFGEDFAIALPNLLAWMLFGLAAYRLARCLGAIPLAAVSCAALCVSAPDAAFQVRTSFVDVALAAFFTSALYMLCEHRRTRTGAAVPTCLVATGVMLGIKASGVVLACLLLVVWVVLRAARPLEASGRHEPQRDGGAAPRSLLLAGLVGLLWLGGFWYLRNWIQVGNPLGFVPLRVAGVELFAGDEFYADLGRTSIARLFDLRSPTDWDFLWRAARERWGIPFLVMAGLPLMLPWVLVRASKNGARRTLLLMAALSGVHVLLYWYSPYTGADSSGSQGAKVTLWIANGLRYAMPLLASVAVLGSLIATHIRWLLPLVWGGALLGCAQMLTRQGSPALWWGIPAAVVAWTAWILEPRALTFRYGMTAARFFASLAVVVCVGASFVARGQRDRQRDVAYGRVQSAIESVVPRGAAVGYLMSVRSYPFYGRYLDRRVDFVPAGERGQFEWIQYMRDRGIRVVAIGPVRKEFMNRKELAWLRAPDGPFQRIFGLDPNRDSILFLLPE
jgi:hypothetical protein